ncbi:hypothetical protein BgiMline_018393 [Biomphalaria glabrata]
MFITSLKTALDYVLRDVERQADQDGRNFSFTETKNERLEKSMTEKLLSTDSVCLVQSFYPLTLLVWYRASIHSLCLSGTELLSTDSVGLVQSFYPLTLFVW